MLLCETEILLEVRFACD